MGLKILAFSGSARAGSLNKKLLDLGAAELTRLGAAVTPFDLRALDLPIYDFDREAVSVPPGLAVLRDAFRAHDGMLIASPEHNGSMTALLKNALDWLSRAPGQKPTFDVIQGKPVAAISAASGTYGGLRGQSHLRQTLQIMRAVVVPETVMVTYGAAAFAEDGTLKDPAVQALLAQAMGQFFALARRLSA